jgi:hypothetical protein
MFFELNSRMVSVSLSLRYLYSLSLYPYTIGGGGAGPFRVSTGLDEFWGTTSFGEQKKLFRWNTFDLIRSIRDQRS